MGRLMLFSLLSTDPAIAVAWIVAIILALTVHEFSHALVGKLRGDKTAEYAGRLTLNPLAHLDPIGFLSMLLIGFGWAKPVPFNPYNLKNPKWDAVAIALAGPGANLVMAFGFGMVLRLLFASGTDGGSLLVYFLLVSVLLNLFLLFFNVIPVHPLDGSKLFFALFSAPKYTNLRNFVALRGPQILLVLVLLSAFTPLDVFSFLSYPAFGLCELFIGSSCGI